MQCNLMQCNVTQCNAMYVCMYVWMDVCYIVRSSLVLAQTLDATLSLVLAQTLAATL